MSVQIMEGAQVQLAQKGMSKLLEVEKYLIHVTRGALGNLHKKLSIYDQGKCSFESYTQQTMLFISCVGRVDEPDRRNPDLHDQRA
jgi:hypothetical protein